MWNNRPRVSYEAAPFLVLAIICGYTGIKKGMVDRQVSFGQSEFSGDLASRRRGLIFAAMSVAFLIVQRFCLHRHFTTRGEGGTSAHEEPTEP